MEKLVYVMVEEIACNPDVGEYITYGIMGERVDLGTKERIDRLVIHDITTKKELAEKIVDLCERNQVSLIHFREVLEDILYIEV